ncbi:hypothetical protein CHU98_g12514 [Xylaria longipes]|nr:hypothetical protein CHU98_g12514 [Xylaria longipes]
MHNLTKNLFGSSHVPTKTVGGVPAPPSKSIVRANVYGEHHYKKFIDYFLEYKERKGWGRTVIDPRTIPRAVLLKRQSAPARILGTESEGQGNRGRARGQPFQVHQPMVASRSPTRQVNQLPMVTNDDRYLPPTAQTNDNSPARRMIAQQQAAQSQPAHMDPQPARGDLRSLRANPRPAPVNQQPGPVYRQGTPFPHNSPPSPNSTSSSSTSSTLDKVGLALALPPGFSEVSNSPKRPAPLYITSEPLPLPTDPSLFVVGDSEDEGLDDYVVSSESDDDVGGQRIFTPSPPPKYNSNNLPAGNLVVPELAHLAQGRQPQVIRRNNGELQQPAPRTPRNKKPIVRNVDSVSDISVVKKLTKVAKDLNIPNVEYIDYDGKWIPRIMTPPKGKRRTRTPTPSPPPTASSHNVADHIANPGPHSYNDTIPIDIGIAANAMSESPIPSKGTAKVGKQNVDIERSPTTYFVQPHPDVNSPTGCSVRVRRSPSHESVAMPPPQTSRRHPNPTLGTSSHERKRRRYSAAVQSCFCDDNMRMSKNSEDKCLSCREREAIAKDTNTTWI